MKAVELFHFIVAGIVAIHKRTAKITKAQLSPNHVLLFDFILPQRSERAKLHAKKVKVIRKARAIYCGYILS